MLWLCGVARIYVFWDVSWFFYCCAYYGLPALLSQWLFLVACHFCWQINMLACLLHRFYVQHTARMKWRRLLVSFLVRGADHMLSEMSQWTENGTMFVDLDWLLNSSSPCQHQLSFLFFKTETKTKTKTFIFVLEAPRESRPRPWSRGLHHCYDCDATDYVRYGTTVERLSCVEYGIARVTHVTSAIWWFDLAL